MFWTYDSTLSVRSLAWVHDLWVGAIMCVFVVFCLWWVWGVFYVIGLMEELGWFGVSTSRVPGDC